MKINAMNIDRIINKNIKKRLYKYNKKRYATTKEIKRKYKEEE